MLIFPEDRQRLITEIHVFPNEIKEPVLPTSFRTFLRKTFFSVDLFCRTIMQNAVITYYLLLLEKCLLLNGTRYG